MFIPDIERQSAAAIQAYQDQRLQETLQYVKRNSRYYQQVFEAQQIDIDSIRATTDLFRLPVTSKEDIQKHHADLVCVPPQQIIDYSTTSGTTGSPLVIPMTNNDIDRLAYNEYISLSCANVQASDTVMLCTTMDKQFMAGIAYFLGIRKIGAGLIRAGVDALSVQWENIKRYQPTVLIAVPSFIVKLLEYAEQNNIDYQNSSVQKIICIGEGIRRLDFSDNNISRRIKSQWSVELFSTYAATEMAAAFTECCCQRGGHHHPELVIIECLDSANRPLPPGQVGELTITTLGVEAFPLIRYKTGDLVSLSQSTCSCGRNTVKVSPVVGRKQQRIKLKGTTIYPPAIANVLNAHRYVKDYLILIDKNELDSDELTVFIDSTIGEKGLPALKVALKAHLRVSPQLKVADIGALRRRFKVHLKRKPVQILDVRTSLQQGNWNNQPQLVTA